MSRRPIPIALIWIAIFFVTLLPPAARAAETVRLDAAAEARAGIQTRPVLVRSATRSGSSARRCARPAPR